MDVLTGSAWNRFGQRFAGALRLRQSTYREVAFDPSARMQAVAVILLGSLVSALVYLLRGDAPGLSIDLDWTRYPVTRQSTAVAALAGGMLDALWGLIVWAIQSTVIWWLWNRFAARAVGWWRVAAPLGFASAPVVVAVLLELVPAAGTILGAIGLLWAVIAGIVAVRASLDIGWPRAIILLLASVVPLLPVSYLLSRLSA